MVRTMQPPGSAAASGRRVGARVAIEVDGLVKSHRAVRAVDGISFSVADGEMFAFLGANGAGKSTTIGCLTTLLRPDAGTVRVAGANVRTEQDRVRRSIGVVFQASLMDDGQTVRENLRLRGTLSRVPARRIGRRIDELSDLIDLHGFLDRPYGRLSGGQRRRADIARALLHEPAILFLDEPTAGLDPASRVAVWSAVDRLREDHGLTVFVTTHYMEETERADHVCIIASGRIVARGTPASLRARYSRSTLTVDTDSPAELRALVGAAETVADGNILHITVPDAAEAFRVLEAHHGHVRDFEFRHGRMDDVFLALTGVDGTGPEDTTPAADTADAADDAAMGAEKTEGAA